MPPVAKSHGAQLAIELKERGGIDIEYCETPSTNLVTQREFEEAGGSENLLRPMLEAGGSETEWIDAAGLQELFPSLNPDYAGAYLNRGNAIA